MTRPATILVERLGLERATRLAAIAGGSVIAVPPQLTGTGHHAGTLRRRIGDDLFVLLVLHFGGSRVYVPTMRPRGRINAREVARLSRLKWSARRIAKRLGCSERAIFKIRAKARRNPRKEPTT